MSCLTQTTVAVTLMLSMITVSALSVQEGLIALWEEEEEDDDDDDESKDEKMPDMPAVSSKPQVDKLWHRVAEERLVVGVILSTDSST